MIKQMIAFTAMVSMMYVVIMIAYRCYTDEFPFHGIDVNVRKPVMRDFPPVEDDDEVPLVFPLPLPDGTDYDPRTVVEPRKDEVDVIVREGTREDLKGMVDFGYTNTITK